MEMMSKFADGDIVRAIARLYDHPHENFCKILDASRLSSVSGICLILAARLDGCRGCWFSEHELRPLNPDDELELSLYLLAGHEFGKTTDDA